jgi:hypothetical protein
MQGAELMSKTHPVGRRVLAVLAALALVVTTACSDDPERADTESLSDATADSDAGAEDEAVGEDQPAPEETQAAAGAVPSEAAPADDPNGPALASLAVPINYIDGGELDMAVTSVDIAGELLRVSIRFTVDLPTGAEPAALGAILTGDEIAPAAGISPELIDPVNLKAYSVVAGAIPNGTSVDLEDGVAHTLVFYFAAPEDDMQTVDIVMSSQTRPITDVPVAP